MWRRFGGGVGAEMRGRRYRCGGGGVGEMWGRCEVFSCTRRAHRHARSVPAPGLPRLLRGPVCRARCRRGLRQSGAKSGPTAAAAAARHRPALPILGALHRHGRALPSAARRAPARALPARRRRARLGRTGGGRPRALRSGDAGRLAATAAHVRARLRHRRRQRGGAALPLPGARLPAHL